MRCMGKDVLNFTITLKPDEAKARGLDSEQEHVIGILGAHHPPEIGYMLRIGTFSPASCSSIRRSPISRSHRPRLRHRSPACLHTLLLHPRTFCR